MIISKLLLIGTLLFSQPHYVHNNQSVENQKILVHRLDKTEYALYNHLLEIKQDQLQRAINPPNRWKNDLFLLKDSIEEYFERRIERPGSFIFDERWFKMLP